MIARETLQRRVPVQGNVDYIRFASVRTTALLAGSGAFQRSKKFFQILVRYSVLGQFVLERLAD
jgi:hypothetical protein